MPELNYHHPLQYLLTFLKKESEIYLKKIRIRKKSVFLTLCMTNRNCNISFACRLLMEMNQNSSIMTTRLCLFSTLSFRLLRDIPEAPRWQHK